MPFDIKKMLDPTITCTRGTARISLKNKGDFWLFLIEGEHVTPEERASIIADLVRGMKLMGKSLFELGEFGNAMDKYAGEGKPGRWHKIKVKDYVTGKIAVLTCRAERLRIPASSDNQAKKSNTTNVEWTN